ncbi:concanavalin A-like lectin/glucanase domain containing protein [Naviculisporaceae sp. PSN 640]
MLLPRRFLASALGLLASSTLVQHAAAQVTTDCQPLNTTCPPNPALSMDLNTHFNVTPKASIWETHVGKVDYHPTDGAMFTINEQGDSPTIRSKFYFFWGRAEIWMKASHGRGIVSSIMFLSDDLDEIDWEFLGGDPVNATTNYFGKGNHDFSKGQYHAVGGVQDEYKNYTIHWTKDALDFYVNGAKVRTLLPKDANNTLYYPQTPMRVYLGIWAGGDPNLPEGTRQWAGGDTDYSKGPYTMFVRSAQVHDFSSGKEYVYSDNSGSWESIQAVQGESKVYEVVNAPPEKSMAEKWEELPSTAKTAIYAGGAGLGAIIIVLAVFYCIRQRRRGVREAKIAEAKMQEERLELERFKQAGIDPDSFIANGHEYNAKEMREEGLTDKDSYSVPNTAAATPTTASANEKWQTAAVGVGAAAGAGAGAAVAANGGMRSPMPFLRDGAQSPRSPQSPGFNAPYSDRPAPGAGGYNASFTDRPANSNSPAPTMNNYGGARSPPPMGDFRSQSPAMGPGGPAMMGNSPQQQNFPPQPGRSFTSPGPGRMASPSPQQQPGFNMAHPQPQRSFTTAGYPSPQQGAFGGQSGNTGGWNQGDQGHWNGGYGR